MSRRGAVRWSVLGLLALAAAGCGGTEEPPPRDPVQGTEPPRLLFVQAEATTVESEGTIALQASAVDPDGGPLLVEWRQRAPEAPVGSFENAAALRTTWLAPSVAQDTSFTLRVQVTDLHGDFAVGELRLTVLAAP